MSSDVWTDGTDYAQTGVMTDITNEVQMDGNFIIITGIFYGFSADGDKVTDRLPDASTDESNDVWMERNFPRFLVFMKFHTAKLVCIFTVNLADGWMDATDNRHIDGWTEFQVES